jgi:hypothetical protein
MGQKQTLQCFFAMSALPPKADIGTQSWNVRFVPKADIDRRYSMTVPITARLPAKLHRG